MLTPEQLAKLNALAEAEGVDPAALRAEAEKLSTAPGPTGSAPGQAREPKLFMYLLPFVKVREVRGTFLGLDDAFEGDDEIASDWATDHPLIGAKAETVEGDAADAATHEDETVTANDSLPGDMIRHDDDGWHAYAGDKHVGGPYKRHGIALRRLRKFDRSYRKPATT